MEFSAPVTILIAEDHAMVREGLVAVCQSRPELKVVGQCADGATAVQMVRSLVPDFAFLDNDMPRLTGIETVRELKQSGSPTRLIILSVSRDEELVTRALEAGADGYLLKDGPSRHLLEAIQYVLDGGVYISPLLHRPAPAAPEPEEDGRFAVLSPREYEIFTHLVAGHRPKDVAALLQISPKTVDTHRASLMRKLNVTDLPALVKLAIGRTRGQ